MNSQGMLGVDELTENVITDIMLRSTTVDQDDQDKTIYWYMRLRDHFFDDPEIKTIMAIPDSSRYGSGFNYFCIVFYLRLLCDSVRMKGYIFYNQKIWRKGDDIARWLHHTLCPTESLDRVIWALDVLKEYGLIEIKELFSDLDVDEPEKLTRIYLPAAEHNTGRSSRFADQRKEERSRAKLKGEQKALESKEALHAYGDLGNVYLTHSDYAGLNNSYTDSMASFTSMPKFAYCSAVAFGPAFCISIEHTSIYSAIDSRIAYREFCFLKFESLRDLLWRPLMVKKFFSDLFQQHWIRELLWGTAFLSALLICCLCGYC